MCKKNCIKTQTETKKCSSDHKPTIAIIISIIAIVIAGLPFYYQYIRINNDVKATIFSFSIDHPEGITYVADVVFINNGNQPCSIVNIMTQTSDVENIISGYIVTSANNQSPFTINPKEVITRQFLMGKSKSDENKFIFEGKEAKRLKFSLAFEIIDSYGKYHEIVVPLVEKPVGESKYSYLKNLPLTVDILPSVIKEGHVMPFARKIEQQIE